MSSHGSARTTDELAHHFAALSPKTGVDLRRATTLRVGGAAQLFVALDSVAAVEQALSLCEAAGVALTLVGLGSNVVVPDEGVRGLVARLGGALAHVTLAGGAPLEPVDSPSRTGELLIEAGAGAVNAHLVRDLHRAGYVGAEFLALVPGTVGGAVVMNAGTRWGELSGILDAVAVVDARHGHRWIAATELGMSYRHTALPKGAVVVGARLRVTPGDTVDAAQRVKDEKAYREATQPYKLATNGSVFANPPGDAAGRLIDAAGLKGTRDGEAQISEKHANWIVNTTGRASAASVLRLMALARRTVRERFGVVLRPEVRLLGGEQPMAGVLDALDA